MTLLLQRAGKQIPAAAGGGGASFPAGITPWARYKADDESGSDGDPVVPQDISGNGRHMTQATSSKRPTLQAGPNGKRVYRFDGLDDECFTPSLAALTGLTAFAVVKVASDPPVGVSTTGFWMLGTSGVGIHVPYTDGNFYDDAGITARQTITNPALSMASTFRRYCVIAASSAFNAYLDNGSIHSVSATVGCATSPRIGSNGGGQYMDGDLAELVLCSAGLSSTDRDALDAYAVSEYGL